MPARTHVFALYLLAAFLGLAACLNVFEYSFLSGQSPFWQAPHADQMQALTGWYGYANDGWRFPLFDVKTLRYPQGANIVFTDSIPLLALVAKAASPWLPADFHYFGWWMALCFVLQAVGAVCALRAWGVADRLALAAGVVLVLNTHAWLIRHNHLALCGHFLVLFAIALYAHTHRAERRRWLPALWCAVAAGATLIHLYLLAMVLALLAAAVLQRAWSRRRNLRQEAAALLAIPLLTALAVAGIAWGSGHFRGEAVQDASGGFGTYSMNLMQPWYPQGALQLPLPLPKLDATGGQYEGYNYLGAGGLLLLLAVFVVAGGPVCAAVRRHGWLVAVLLLLTAFSLSNRVYWGETAVLSYRVPDLVNKPVEIFRSSGRFFWPVGYVLVLGGVVLLARARERRPWVGLLLVAAAGLQWVDAAPSRAFPREDTRQAPAPQLPGDSWQPLIAAHTLVRTFPGFRCGPGENHRISQELQLLAARSGVPVSTVFMARQQDDCVAERELVDTLKPGPGELVVYLPPFQLEHTRPSFSDSRACRNFPGGIVCSRRLLEDPFNAELSRGALESYFAEISLPGFQPSPYRLGQEIAIEATGPGAAMLYSGWFAPESDGAWMQGRHAQLRLLRDDAAAGDVRLSFRAKAYLSPKQQRKRLTIYVNRQRLVEIPVANWQPTEYRVEIPAGVAMASSGTLRVDFEIDPVSSPATDGVSEDARELGIQLQSLKLEAVSTRAQP